MKSIKTMLILLCGMLGHFIAYNQDLNSSVYFESGESKLSKKALVELEEVLEICKKHPDVAIDIKAYADDRGSEKMNQKLSKRRASRVVQFLKENGLNPHKQLVNGLGEVALKNKNDVTSERQRNRRVDIEIKPFAPQNWDDYYSFYKKRNTEVFQIRNDRDTCIVGKKGTVLFIPKNSFQTKNGKEFGNDLVEVKLYEAYSYKDMLFQNLTTVSNGRMLETGGMIHLEANRISDGSAVEVREGKELRLTMPSSEKLPEGMQLFTAERNLKATDKSINWVTDGKNKFEQPDLLKTIKTSLDVFSKLIQTENEVPIAMDMPTVNLELVKKVPVIPSIRPVPAKNFSMPNPVSDFETFKVNHPPKQGTRVKRKETKGQYKKRMEKDYRLAKLYFRRDSTQYERYLKKYNAALALHVQDSLSYASRMAIYKVEKSKHEEACNEIRTWLANYVNNVELWTKQIEHLNKLAVDGKSIRKYFVSIKKMFSLKEQMKQEAQRAGFVSVLDTLDDLALNLTSVKRAAIKLHLSVKDLKIEMPPLYQTGATGVSFKYAFEFRNYQNLEADELIEVYKEFMKINALIPTLETLVTNFDAFRNDPALKTVIDYLGDLKAVNNLFREENAKRKLIYFVKVWEAKWYDALSDSEKDDFDARSIYEKEVFANEYIAKKKEAALLAKLASMEREYKGLFTPKDKVAYSKMTTTEKEYFMRNFVRQRYNRIENVVGIRNLGWINCDAFSGQELMLVNIPKPNTSAKDAKYYLCLQDRRSVLPLTNSGTMLKGNIPPGSNVKIIGIAINAGKVAVSETNGNIDDLNNHPLRAFKEMRMDDLAALIH